MLLFSRIVTPTGSLRRVMTFAGEVTAYVNANSPLDVTCWSGTFGYPIGTLAWSSMVASQSELAAATAGLLGQDGYLDLLDSAADLVAAPGQDVLREVIYGTPGEPPAVGSVAAITTATAVVDRMAEAVGWAVEIAQHIEGVLGSPIAVLTDVYGTMGGVTWIGIQPDIAAADVASGKLRADADYLGKLAGSKGLFLPGSGHVAQVTRIV